MVNKCRISYLLSSNPRELHIARTSLPIMLSVAALPDGITSGKEVERNCYHSVEILGKVR